MKKIEKLRKNILGVKKKPDQRPQQPDFRFIHHVNQDTIKKMYEHYSPVFVLTTGRSGSRFLYRFFDSAANMKAYHEARPTLQYFSHYAYHHQNESDLLKKVIETARMELILEAYIQSKIYFEANQCLTFFGPFLNELFSSSKFVHLIRHPGDFVCSAVRKGWHRNDSIWEAGRVKLNDEPVWNQLDQIEKLSWVWNATNNFIMDFKKNLEKHRILTVRLEDITQSDNKLKGLINFVGARGLDDKQIGEFRNQRINTLEIHDYEPPNMKKIADFPRYSEWKSSMREKLARFTEPLAKTFHYNL